MQISKNIIFVAVGVIILIAFLPLILSSLVTAGATTGVDASVTAIMPIVQIVAALSPIGVLFLLWSIRNKG